MKGFKAVFAIAVIALAAVGGCKKDESPATTNNPNNTGNCNFTTDVIAVDGVTKNIIRPLCHVLGSAYYAEFLVDTSAAPTGVAMVFFGGARPSPGTYTIVPAFPTAAGTVYVEYYDPTNAWIGTTGTVTVTAAGSQVVITFCSLALIGVNAKVVSVRATTNL
ncbi:MAG TPA: hypothetical protein DGH68_12035 [Bacteroidetes bacterium]|jgi:hypothetical protein|nr:hypothetical protein [Bacteroidota bacterium]